jgi:hypothetical protein
MVDYFTTTSVSKLHGIASNGKITDERRNGKGLEGSGCGQIKVLSRYLHGRTE